MIQPPHEILKTRYMSQVRMSDTELAQKMGIHYSEAVSLLTGEYQITHNIANRLAHAFPKTIKSTWLKFQRDYNAACQRNK